MTSRGVVRVWHREDGWGVLECAQTPVGCWVHSSEVDVPGFRALDPGDQVDFEWQRSSGPVEGFAFVASQARPVSAE
ncbi:cold shock domain-containing protein [Rhodococcus ruber]|uniref:cold shock domain-containing protein n=1 Tax=Rhodococcus ruber TaxID=1830 RepID=UPI000C7C232F|nr:cold shock domain-containing protein [Rhodococcus ruber]AUM20257.1 hypothetical protein CSW53_27205 [Rhodococcus ruber]